METPLSNLFTQSGILAVPQNTAWHSRFERQLWNAYLYCWHAWSLPAAWPRYSLHGRKDAWSLDSFFPALHQTATRSKTSFSGVISLWELPASNCLAKLQSLKYRPVLFTYLTLRCLNKLTSCFETQPCALNSAAWVYRFSFLNVKFTCLPFHSRLKQWHVLQIHHSHRCYCLAGGGEKP